MKEKNDRRSFLKKFSVGGLSAAVLPGAVFAAPPVQEELQQLSASKVESKNEKRQQRSYNEVYKGEYLNRVAFPIGGMGAGMFCLEGTGAISHMSIRNKPEMFHEPSMFAAVAVKGLEKGAKVLEGPVQDWKMFGRRGTGNGVHGATYGLPRMEKAIFDARFPFGNVRLNDDDLPLEVELTGWSPFIPTDEDNSSLPVGALEYKFVNKGKETIEAVFSYNARNFVVQHQQKGTVKSTSNGFVLTQESTEEKPHLQTDFAIFTDDSDTVVDHRWFRGGWFDPLTMVWNTIKEGKVKSNEPVEEGAPGASLFVPFKLNPGEERIIRVMMAWYVPESELHFGEKVEEEGCDPASGCCSTPAAIGLDGEGKPYTAANYKPWYSSKFNDIHEVTHYWQRNYDDLHQKSALFRDAFYASTLPPEVLEAIAANLTILKSPTVMRQYDGRMWNWEGCSDDWGCCHGSCTHVWNYAQAIPHLFPALERSFVIQSFVKIRVRPDIRRFGLTCPFHH